MFTRIRGKYDQFNRLLSFGRDQKWRHELTSLVLSNGADSVLDLAAGTGDITLMLQETGLTVTAADACAPMLELANEKGVQETVVCSAENLPFDKASFDAVTIGWGYRNFSDRAKSLEEILKVLKPGGWLYILECSQPLKPLRPFHHFYMATLCPSVVSILGGNAEAYRYLAESTAQFPDAETLASDIKKAGFEMIGWKHFGLGAIALHQARKPE